LSKKLQALTDFLIDQMLKAMGFNYRTKPKDAPVLSSKILHRDISGPTHEMPSEYRMILGELNFLENQLDQTLNMLCINVPGSWQTLGPHTSTQCLELVDT
jgi:hypothetical protein